LLTRIAHVRGGAGLRPAHEARGSHENKHFTITWCLFS